MRSPVDSDNTRCRCLIGLRLSLIDMHAHYPLADVVIIALTVLAATTDGQSATDTSPKMLRILPKYQKLPYQPPLQSEIHTTSRCQN